MPLPCYLHLQELYFLNVLVFFYLCVHICVCTCKPSPCRCSGGQEKYIGFSELTDSYKLLDVGLENQT